MDNNATKPKVSVVMAVFNSERYIRQAIESILNQEFKNFEFIIINDCSGDNSLEMIKDYSKKDKRITVINNHSNQGAASARNSGIKVARGKYIAIMDSDDISVLDRFKKSVAFLDAHKEIGLLGGAYKVIDEQGAEIGTVATFVKDIDIRRQMFIGCPFGHGTTMIRKSALDHVGSYNKDMHSSHDYDLWARVAKKYKMANLSTILCSWRINTKGITSTKKQEQTANAKKVNDKIWEKLELPDLTLGEAIRELRYYQKLDSPLNKNLANNFKDQQYLLSIALIKRRFYLKGLKSLIAAFIIFPYGLLRLIKIKLTKLFRRNIDHESI